MKKQMNVTSLDDVTVILLTYMKGVYKEAHTSPGKLVVSPSGTPSDSSFGSFLGSHRPSVSAAWVPLEKWDNYHTGKCSLFV